MSGGTHSLELAAFVCHVTPKIRAALSKRGLRRSELDDGIQEVLIGVVERWPKLRSYPPAARDGYVRAICRGTAVGWRRKTRHETDRFTEIDVDRALEHAQPISPERQYSISRLRSALHLCLNGSDSSTRMSFLLVYLAGHTEAETASIQGVPLGTVASRLRRMRARLCGALRPK